MSFGHIDLVNQVFEQKTLVIKMMNVGGGPLGGRRHWFPEHNSATVRNMRLILIEQVSAVCCIQE